jgi:hypothetical protein
MQPSTPPPVTNRQVVTFALVTAAIVATLMLLDMFAPLA